MADVRGPVAWRDLPIAAGPRHRSSRLVAGASAVVTWALSWAVALVTDVFVAVPGRLAGAVVHRDALGPGRLAGSLWRVSTPVAARPARSTAGTAPGDPVRGSARLRRPRVTALAGIVAVVLFVDLAAGALADRVFGPADAASPIARVVDLGPSRSIPPGSLASTDWDTRWQGPAMQSQPWAHAYLQDLQGMPTVDQPFLTQTQVDVRSRFITITDGIRRSWQPGGSGADVPVVWLFGGSTLWGEGQRDQHTIPSELARIAAAEGHPIRVENFGQRAYTNFQEFLLLEQQLAVRPAPDLVVFYDGANEISYRIDHPGDQPIVFPSLLGPGAEPDGTSLPETWARRSALAGLLGAGADESSSPPPSVIADQVLDVWGRGLRLARATARAHGVRFVSTFQPAQYYAQEPVAMRVRRNLPPGVIDLSHALDGAGDATYIDLVHTNEEGARIVAKALARVVAASLTRPAD